ncbi:CAAX amino terminal protease self- immunity [Anatilimnocola aggregata]|uniref:CAAX amino terminal protease self-immunity n=1 Tax=Anatilimnocola aggregata TaxID=2528021 RepID=A0A517YLM0_9BACT|nr:CPBP family intramembrane glutamic endopeptidase [Anatilimnocola aggregata]QDU31098.1 CAAX amino terminal protease self- immunity [Anatilimnocola aggregata]
MPATAAQRFVLITVCFEGALAVLALGLGWLLGFSPWYGVPPEGYDLVRASRDILWGLFATAPPVLVLLVEDRIPGQPLQAVKDQVTDLLGRVLAGATAGELLLIACLAGIGEELLFRGFLQAGLVHLLPGSWAVLGSLVIASVAFGLCHFLSRTYFVLATIAGLYFGMLMLVSGSIVPAIIAHAFYDFVALVYLADESRQANNNMGC